MSNKVFKRVAATLLAVLLLFYVGLQIYNSNHSSIQTETATYMTASDTIETTGYIVRNETYLTSDAGGVLNYVLEDGESVKENGVVAQIYASAEDAVATVVASGYFSAATSKLRTQDTILISATDGAGLRRVTSATGATPVTVTTGS